MFKTLALAAVLAVAIFGLNGCGAAGSATGFDPTPVVAPKAKTATFARADSAGTVTVVDASGTVIQIGDLNRGYDVIGYALPFTLSQVQANVASATAVYFWGQVGFSFNGPESVTVNTRIVSPAGARVTWNWPMGAPVVRRSDAFQNNGTCQFSGEVNGVAPLTEVRFAISAVGSDGTALGQELQFTITTLDAVANRVDKVNRYATSAKYRWNDLFYYTGAADLTDHSAMNNPLQSLQWACEAETTVLNTLSTGNDMYGSLTTSTYIVTKAELEAGDEVNDQANLSNFLYRFGKWNRKLDAQVGCVTPPQPQFPTTSNKAIAVLQTVVATLPVSVTGVGKTVVSTPVLVLPDAMPESAKKVFTNGWGRAYAAYKSPNAGKSSDAVVALIRGAILACYRQIWDSYNPMYQGQGYEGWTYSQRLSAVANGLQQVMALEASIVEVSQSVPEVARDVRYLQSEVSRFRWAILSFLGRMIEERNEQAWGWLLNLRYQYDPTYLGTGGKGKR